MRLVAEDLTLRYGPRIAVRRVSLTVTHGELVAIVGPNGGGKSTLLRGLARLHKPAAGRVLLGDNDIRALNARAVARVLAVLPQSPPAWLDLTVRELTWRGRYPHQGLLQRATSADHDAVAWAMDAADVACFADRSLLSLSGGERQRAWIALALAQQPAILLLDEPTSFLDIRHQVEIMQLLQRLNADGITVVVVLHDLALASRHAQRVVGLRDGQVAFDGSPLSVFQPPALEAVFGVPMTVFADPETGLPIPFPRAIPAGQ
jgi:iron complex transport system ATP-binding protein